MMPDRKKVISHLQIIHTWASFALENDLSFFTMAHMESLAEWTTDTLKLLKEQPQIVRCKDCEHIYFASNRVPDERSYACGKHGIDIVPEWFCADGERKDNG